MGGSSKQNDPQNRLTHPYFYFSRLSDCKTDNSSVMEEANPEIVQGKIMLILVQL